MVAIIAAAIALVSFGLTLWQWAAARGFPLHQRLPLSPPVPGVTLLKPLKGCDSQTEACLESWLRQAYPGDLQVLFGVASATDPVCAVVNRLMAAYPSVDAELIICPRRKGANAKISTLVQLAERAKFDLLVVSDADVWAPPDLLPSVIAQLARPDVGLVTCLYHLAPPLTKAMLWETVAVNADFWSQVLQSRSLKPLDFALGAVMATKWDLIKAVGGFSVLADYLADDFQLGNRIAGLGRRIELCSVVVECRSAPMGWRQVWAHQLRWALTIRVCRPVPYLLSILSNATLWPAVWLALDSSQHVFALALTFWTVRIVSAVSNERRLSGRSAGWQAVWIVPLKDVLGAFTWALAFMGRNVAWRGLYYRIQRDGRLEELPTLGAAASALQEERRGLRCGDRQPRQAGPALNPARRFREGHARERQGNNGP